MGLFGGNAEAKNIKTNEANKKAILNQIQILKMNCKDVEIIKLIAKLTNCLQQQGETSRVEVLDVDTDIVSLLDEVNEYLLVGQEATAIAKISQCYGLAVSRQKYCSFGGRMNAADAKALAKAKKQREKLNKKKEKTRIDELQEMIDRKNAELHGYEAEFNILGELYEKYPGNVSLSSRGETLIALKEQVDAELGAMLDELAGQVAFETAKKTADTSATLKEKRARYYDEKEIANIKAQLEQTQQQRMDLRNQTSSLRDMVRGSSRAAMDSMATTEAAATTTNNPFATAQSATARNPFATGMGATVNNPFAQSAPAAQTQFGGFDASAMGTAQMANEIQKTIRALQQSIEQYEEKIDEADEEFKEYNRQLVRLLDKRETASPADCLALDGQIDQLNSRRSNVSFSIKRYRQAMAQLSDKLSLMEKLATQQDLTATNAQIEKLTNGKFTDFAGLSMFLNESVKESNAQLEEIGVAVNISEGEEISMNSASGASAAFADVSNVKDEHKYDELKKELKPTARTL